jgi:flagellar basal-body rod protein FlgG
MQIRGFPHPHPPTTAGEGLFQGANPRPAKDVNLALGHLEESGVNAIGEMVKLIEVMRTFESAQKLIQTMDGMTNMAIQEVGKVA